MNREGRVTSVNIWSTHEMVVHDCMSISLNRHSIASNNFLFLFTFCHIKSVLHVYFLSFFILIYMHHNNTYLSRNWYLQRDVGTCSSLPLSPPPPYIHRGCGLSQWSFLCGRHLLFRIQGDSNLGWSWGGEQSATKICVTFYSLFLFTFWLLSLTLLSTVWTKEAI